MFSECKVATSPIFFLLPKRPISMTTLLSGTVLEIMFILNIFDHNCVIIITIAYTINCTLFHNIYPKKKKKNTVDELRATFNLENI